jgi:hypothetical protein
MTPKFKKGDRVKVLDGSKIKPKGQEISWKKEMNQYIGKVYKVILSEEEYSTYILNNDWDLFDENWLELFEPKV